MVGSIFFYLGIKSLTDAKLKLVVFAFDLLPPISTIRHKSMQFIPNVWLSRQLGVILHRQTDKSDKDIMKQKFCQSCGMPLTDDVLGTNADGTKNVLST